MQYNVLYYTISENVAEMINRRKKITQKLKNFAAGKELPKILLSSRIEIISLL